MDRAGLEPVDRVRANIYLSPGVLHRLYGKNWYRRAPCAACDAVGVNGCLCEGMGWMWVREMDSETVRKLNEVNRG